MKVGPQVAQAKHIGSGDFELHSLKENLAGTLSFVENMKTTSRLWRGTYALTEDASLNLISFVTEFRNHHLQRKAMSNQCDKETHYQRFRRGLHFIFHFA